VGKSGVSPAGIITIMAPHTGDMYSSPSDAAVLRRLTPSTLPTDQSIQVY
jgi:hypothetical protein